VGPDLPNKPGTHDCFLWGVLGKARKETSADWNLEEVRSGKSTAPLVSKPSEPVDTGSEFRPVIEPGDLLCFSGAHLHASVPNSTDVARFSVEVRTVDAGDAADGRGAPNVDGEAPAWPRAGSATLTAARLYRQISRRCECGEWASEIPRRGRTRS
jgi:hypothetical protein